jgi:hypothetical protein
MILFVGFANEELVEVATAYSTNATLITEDTWNCGVRPEVGYTGLEEFSNTLVFVSMLVSATKIIYYPNRTETNIDLENPTDCTRGLLENILLSVGQTTPVENLKNNILGLSTVTTKSQICLELVDRRKTDLSQLWGVGCSFTYGSAVDYSQRYISLLAKKLDMSVSCLAQPGGTISWSADQILRSDIRKGDIVVWGLTSKFRFTWFHDNCVWNFTPVEYKKFNQLSKIIPLSVVTDYDNARYQSLTHIHQVDNFCNKIGAKLLLVGLLTGPDDLLYLYNLPNFYQFYNKDSVGYVDVGYDGVHPGPLQHQQYANIIFKQLELRNWI